jgi:hypothetical protein
MGDSRIQQSVGCGSGRVSWARERLRVFPPVPVERVAQALEAVRVATLSPLPHPEIPKIPARLGDHPQRSARGEYVRQGRDAAWDHSSKSTANHFRACRIANPDPI